MNEVAQSLTLPVDAEHSGIRVAVVVAFLVLWVIGYFAITAVVGGVGLNLLSLIGGFVVAYLVTSLLERWLKQRWPSGRTVEVDAEGARIRRNTSVERSISAAAPVNVLCWSFQTRRRSRVPKGWHVLACALEQDDVYLPVYTFFSPDRLKTFRYAERFTALKREADLPKAGGGRDDLLLAGEQRRLREAENQRWASGAEMSADDFEQFLTHLHTHFRDWIMSR